MVFADAECGPVTCWTFSAHIEKVQFQIQFFVRSTYLLWVYEKNIFVWA